MKKITFRQATSDDLSSIIYLLANDSIGSTREVISKNISNSYIDAFQEIDADPNAQIIVMLNDSSFVGCVQINFIRNLTYEGGLRCQVEGVRVSSAYQGLGLGQMLFDHIFHISKNKGCHMVQLTCDSRRPDAIRFYKKLGFQSTHEGFKYHLS